MKVWLDRTCLGRHRRNSMRIRCLALGLTVSLWVSLVSAQPSPKETGGKTGNLLPVRGIHLSAPSKRDLADALVFIRESLPREGVNTLILEFNYGFNFRSRPEFANSSALGKEDVQQIVNACRAGHIELIPQIN